MSSRNRKFVGCAQVKSRAIVTAGSDIVVSSGFHRWLQAPARSAALMKVAECALTANRVIRSRLSTQPLLSIVKGSVVVAGSCRTRHHPLAPPVYYIVYL